MRWLVLVGVLVGSLSCHPAQPPQTEPEPQEEFYTIPIDASSSMKFCLQLESWRGKDYVTCTSVGSVRRWMAGIRSTD